MTSQSLYTLEQEAGASAETDEGIGGGCAAAAHRTKSVPAATAGRPAWPTRRRSTSISELTSLFSRQDLLLAKRALWKDLTFPLGAHISAPSVTLPIDADWKAPRAARHQRHPVNTRPATGVQGRRSFMYGRCPGGARFAFAARRPVKQGSHRRWNCPAHLP